MTTVGVTGAEGFIGSALVRRLVASGAVVHGLDVREGDTAGRCRGSGGRFVTGTVTDAGAVARFVAGCDTVLHTAALVAESGSWPEFVRVNGLGPAAVARAARAAGATSFLHLSSVMVHGFDYPDGVGEDGPVDGAGNPYCWTKIVSEREVLPLHEPGRFAVHVVRPGDVYGPRSVPWTVRPVRHLRQRTFVHVDPEHALINQVYVEDLVAAVLAVLERGAGGVPYAVTEGRPTLARDFFGRYQRMLGVRFAPTLPGGTALALARAASGLPPSVRRRLDLERESIRFLLRRGRYASARVRDLGWVPRVDLDEGMARTEAWLGQAGLLSR